jgi:hypothetical protein
LFIKEEGAPLCGISTFVLFIKEEGDFRRRVKDCTSSRKEQGTDKHKGFTLTELLIWPKPTVTLWSGHLRVLLIPY